jgi:dolichol-phosphate mannosyltransferase
MNARGDECGAAEPATLAVVIPMLDEEANAERCVRAVCAALAESFPESRLYVVDDGSRDATPSILAALEKEGLPLVVVSHAANQGYGRALLTGAAAARADGFDFALFMDSDLTNDPALIPRFQEAVAAGDCDLVKASRYVPGGGMRGVPLHHRVVTGLANRLAARLFAMGIRDCTNGFRAVRLALLAELPLREPGFPAILEELYLLKKAGARAKEIPYILTSRGPGQGRSRFRYRPALLYRYLKYAVKAARV